MSRSSLASASSTGPVPPSPRPPPEAEANELRAQLYGLWAILALHFDKEEAVLLPILDAHLTDRDAVALFERMDAVAHPSGPRGRPTVR